MLQAIRDRSKGFLAGLVITIICIPFALVGIEQYFNPNIEEFIARVGEEEITQNEYQRQFSRYRQNLSRQMGDALDPTFFDQLVIKRQFLDQIVQRAALLQTLRDNGYAVPDGAVRGEIAAVEAFQVAGQFDPNQYQLMLSAQGMTPREFETSVREDLLSTQLASALGASSLVTDEQIDAAIRLQDQRRAATYVTVSADEFADAIEVSDADVQEWYEDNGDRYLSQEEVTVEYIELQASDYAPDIEVDENLLRERYELQKARYVTPERRLASHILLTVEDDETDASETARAAELAERAREGEDFAALAQEFSQDPGSAESGGDLDWVEEGMMVPAFEEALFAMDAGAVSDPVESEFGIHVIQLREIEPSRGKSFDEVREELADEVRQADAERLFVSEQDRLLDLSYEDQTSLNLAAEELDVEVETSEPFTRLEGTGIAGEKVVRDAAFATATLEDGVNSDLITIGDDRAVVLRVVSHRLPERRPLEDVSDQIAGEIRAERAREQARSEASALLAAVQGGQALDEAAGEADREFVATGLVGRSDFETVPGALLPELFKLPRPDSETGDETLQLVPYGGDNFAVVSLSQVQDGRPAEVESERRAALAQQIAGATARAEIAAVSDAIRASTDIQIAEDRL